MTWKWCESNCWKSDVKGVTFKSLSYPSQSLSSELKDKWSESDVRVTWKWCESDVKVMWKWYDSDVKVIWKGYESDVKVILKWFGSVSWCICVTESEL